MISVITPVRGCPELAVDYQRVVDGCEVIIIDNASDEAATATWQGVATHYLRNETPQGYAAACNQGYQRATGDIVFFLNNDVRGQVGALQRAAHEVRPHALYGCEVEVFQAPAQPIIYIAGWCVGATRAAWDRLAGPWDADTYPGNYAEDLDLSWRAARAGLALRRLHAPIEHLSNYTSKRTPGAYDYADANRARFVQRWREARAC